MEKDQQFQWWQREVIYQIYPRSFQDSNGDGVGDLRGIRSRLDYLHGLGIKIIWISPIFPSPMADFGYDISDYVNIHSIFGSLSDFDALLKEVHANGMKLILDLVPNHTSDQHPWFLESKSSRTNLKRDWYLWQDARPDGTVPNNWLSVFGGSAWEWNEETQQFYYHAFLKEQPDLNWRNPEVQNAMFDVMRFWLDRGVDGFRVDVMWHLIKDCQLRDNPVNANYKVQMPTYDKFLPVYSTDQPEVHDLVKNMRDVLDEYRDRMMIGEIYLPIHRLVAYYGVNNRGAHLPFNFQLLTISWNAQVISSAIAEYEGALPSNSWPNWVLSNHDQPRIASRVGLHQAAVAAMLLLTLRGTPTIYYGDEIGMMDVPIPLNEIVDPQGLRMPDKNLSRDPSRTPMQWDDSIKGGFTEGTPWLRLARNYQKVNVQAEKKDSSSMLSLYRRLIALRNQEASLRYGAYTPLYADHQLLSYIREVQGEPRFLVLLNFSHRPCYFRPTNFSFEGVVEVSTSLDLEGSKVADVIELAGDEGMVVRLN